MINMTDTFQNDWHLSKLRQDLYNFTTTLMWPIDWLDIEHRAELETVLPVMFPRAERGEGGFASPGGDVPGRASVLRRFLHI